MERVGAFGLIAVLMSFGLPGCRAQERAERETPRVENKAQAPVPPAAFAPPPESKPTLVQPQPAIPPGVSDLEIVEPSGEEIARETMWAPGHEGQLIQGLDGGQYETYAPAVVQQVQQKLRRKGLYNGPINGILDQDTMEALGEYQENNGLQVCGVPTPRTREALLAEG
jgi:hypothetical protein